MRRTTIAGDGPTALQEDAPAEALRQRNGVAAVHAGN